MLTLDPGKQIAEQLRPDSGQSANAESVIGLDTPAAYESQVADAVCYLLSGFFIVEGIVEDLGGSPRQPHCAVTTLAVVAQMISTAFEELSNCSFEFWWLVSQSRIQVLECFPRYGRTNGYERDSPGDSMESTQKEQSVWDPLSQGPDAEPHGSTRRDQVTTDLQCGPSITHSEWDAWLASAVLHLVGAYRTMETLSASAFPAGAPRSFETASRCLCTALLTLDTCLAESES